MIIRNLFTVILFVFTTCDTHKGIDSKLSFERFDRDSFPSVQKVDGELLSYDSSLYPVSFRLIQDSILYVELLHRSSEGYLAKLYKFPEMEYIKSILYSGRGPGEFLSARLIYQNIFSNSFIIHDVVGSRIASYRIDSTLNHTINYAPEVYRISDAVLFFTKVNDTLLLGYNSYYLNNSEFPNLNNVDEFVLFNHKGETFDYAKPTDIKLFTLNAVGASLLASEEKNRIIVADYYKDQIRFYDKAFKLIKALEGPDLLAPTYRVVKSHSNTVLFERGKMFGAFEEVCSTSEHVFLLYKNLNGIDVGGEDGIDPMYHVPSEVYKFTWDGQPIACYQLDRFIWGMSVDSKGEYIYGTHWKTYGEQAELVRYKLD